METFNLFTAPAAHSVKWKASKITWPEIVRWAMEPASVKECGGYVLGAFRGNVRRTSELIQRDVLTLDADIDGAVLPELVEALSVRSLVHDTFSSAPDQVKKRILLPLSRPVTGAEYEVLAEAVAQHLGIQRFDRTSFRPAQFMWKPATPQPSWYDFTATAGPDLDVETWIRRYDATLAAESLTGPRRVQKRDPATLGGVVGAFNRAYPDLNSLVAKYDLPYVEEAPDRWRYAESHSIAGMGPVRGAAGLYFSHHATDEAGGQTCSAFDLVRIHHFGHLDEGAKPGTPITKLKSHVAMEQIALKDPDVMREQRKEALGDLEAEFSNLDPTLLESGVSDAWRQDLTLSKLNKVLPTPENKALIYKNDPVFKLLAYNDMTYSVETRQPFPWDKKDRPSPELARVDSDFIDLHLQRAYKLKLPLTEVEGMIRMGALVNRYNPLAEWLDSLEWDGEERLDTCLPGVVDTPYTRLVARKALIGAVARALSPGCQMDFSLILTGSEGVGKSRWIRHMAVRPEWTGELESLGNKDTSLTLAKKWIMVSDEVDAMKKAEFSQLKSFLTKTHDNFRIPYDTSVRMYPRHCVIWGTTNDPKFLRRQEGNRRFLIVECVELDGRCLDHEWVEQVWAEAVAAYRSGELTYMTSDEMSVASSAREEFTQDDPLLGKIITYVDMDVPFDWNAMSVANRAAWYAVDRHISDQGLTKQDVVCAQAILDEVIGVRGLVKDWEVAQIVSALRNLPGWIDGGIQRTPVYGPQHVFIREAATEPGEVTTGYDLI